MLKLLLILCIMLAPPAKANVVEDAWGIVTDPLKIGSAGDSAVKAVNRATEALVTLQRETDSDIRDYLKELSGLILQLEGAIDRQSSAVITRIVKEINQFSDRLDRSINSAIVQLECAAEVTLNDTLKRSMGGNVKFITRDKLEIVLPFQKPSSGFWSSLFDSEEDDIIEIDLSRVSSPFRVYEDIRDRHLENLKYIKPDSRTKDLVLIYADIARFARFAHCHYRNDAYGLLLSREYTHFDSLVRPWVSAVRIEIESIY